MRVLLLAAGTRGDVLPALALAEHLSQAGHDVAMYLDSDSYGAVNWNCTLRLLPWADSISFEGSWGLRSGRGKPILHAVGLINYERAVLDFTDPLVQSLELESRDVVIYTPILSFIVYPAKMFGLKAIALHYQPCFHTSSHPSPYLSVPAGPAWFNRLTFELTKLGAVFTDQKAARKVRSTGARSNPWQVLLAQSWNRADVHLQAFSPTLTKMVPNSWTNVVRTGALRLRSSFFSEPPETTDTTIKNVSPLGPTVYFGLSRPAEPKREEVLALFSAAVQKMGGILLANLRDFRIDYAVDGCLDVTDVDHSLLFQNVDLAIVEGGAGTCHAAALCGVPMLVVPYWFDQFTWRDVLIRIGLAYPGDFSHAGTAEDILSVLAWAKHPSVIANARRISQMIQQEGEPADNALAVIETLINDRIGVQKTPV